MKKVIFLCEIIALLWNLNLLASSVDSTSYYNQLLC